MAFRTRAEIRRSTFKTARSIGANFRDEKFKILRTTPGYNLQLLKIHEFLDIPMKKHNKSVTTSWLTQALPKFEIVKLATFIFQNKREAVHYARHSASLNDITLRSVNID